MLGRKWHEHKLCALASAYGRAVRPLLSEKDKPLVLPKTELHNIVQKRQKDRDASSISHM